MATDFIKVLQEIRGIGAPDAAYTDGIYWDITVNDESGFDGIYGHMIHMYTNYSIIKGLVIGNVTTVPNLEDHTHGAATASYDDVTGELNFGIPAGDKGDTGTITVGTTTTLAPGSLATVENSGTVYEATVDFGIPEGLKGSPGATGSTGGVGPTGPTGAAQVGSLSESALGKIDDALLYVPFKTNLNIEKGNGSITFSRASAARFTNIYGSVEVASIDTPRFEVEGLLMEDEGINYFLESEAFDTNSINWNFTDIAITQNAEQSPEEGSGASLFESIGTTASFVTQSVSTPQPGDYPEDPAGGSPVSIVSMYFKAYTSTTEVTFSFPPESFGDSIERIATLDLASKVITETGSNMSTFIEELANGWIRFTMSAKTDSASETRSAKLEIPLGTNVLVWGAQYEQPKDSFTEFNSMASSYIPSDISKGIRSEDFCELEYYGNIGSPAHDASISLDLKQRRSDHSYVVDIPDGRSVFSYIQRVDIGFSQIPPLGETFIRSGEWRSRLGSYQHSTGAQETYRDGVNEGSRTEVTNMVAPTAPSSEIITIGGASSGGRGMTANISNLRIWNRVMNAAEARLLCLTAGAVP